MKLSKTLSKSEDLVYLTTTRTATQRCLLFVFPPWQILVPFAILTVMNLKIYQTIKESERNLREHLALRSSNANNAASEQQQVKLGSGKFCNKCTMIIISAHGRSASRGETRNRAEEAR